MILNGFLKPKLLRFVAAIRTLSQLRKVTDIRLPISSDQDVSEFVELAWT